MKRTELKRHTPMPRAKPASQPKRRTRKCALKECRQPFEPRSMTHRACGPECAALLVTVEKAAQDRRERQQGLAKLKRRADYLKEAQISFNAFIRERDKNQPCICCGRTTTNVEGLNSHGWDCGHYRSVGSAPNMRFIENNAHRQLVVCNRYGGGRAVDYRIGLIARIGLEAVEALEADQTPRKYSIAELQGIRATYKAKLAALKGNREN